MNTNDSACKNAVVGEVIVQRDTLDKHIEELAQAVDALEVRLGSVLKCAPPVSPGVIGIPTDGGTAPLATDLQRLCNKVNNIADRVRGITSRLEV